MKPNTTPPTISRKASKPAHDEVKDPSPSAFSPTAEDVAVRAYTNYQNHGAADGRDVEDWLAAETALCAEEELAHC
jgi:Protein of unknown function (DUF2934)